MAEKEKELEFEENEEGYEEEEGDEEVDEDFITVAGMLQDLVEADTALAAALAPVLAGLSKSESPAVVKLRSVVENHKTTLGEAREVCSAYFDEEEEEGE